MEAAGSAVDWSQEHQGKLIAGIVALAAIAAIAFGGWYYVNQQDQKASLDLAVAVRTMETPIRPAGTPEQPGFPSFDSSTVRATEARKQFQAIVDKYSSTHSAKVARYFVGLTSAQLADYSAAESNLQQTANASDSDLASLGKLALASVYASEKKDDQAVDLYKQLSDKPTMLVSKATSQFELAGFYASHQKLDDAKKTYELIQKENPKTEIESLAQQRLAALK